MQRSAAIVPLRASALTHVSRSVVFVVLALACGIAASAQPPKAKPIWARNNPLPYGLNPGEPFPTLALPSAADGRPTSAAQFRGKKLVVNIFASW